MTTTDYRVERMAQQHIYQFQADQSGTFVVCTICGRTDYLHTLECPAPAALALAGELLETTNVIERIAKMNSPEVTLEARVLAVVMINHR